MVFLKMKQPVKNIFDDFKSLRLVHESIPNEFHLEVASFTVFGYDVAPIFVHENIPARNDIFMLEGQKNIDLGLQ